MSCLPPLEPPYEPGVEERLSAMVPPGSRPSAAEFSEAQLLDLLLLCGWYHAISFTANAARVALQDGAPRFGDVS